MARRRREEHPEPVHVVVGVQQRRELLFDRAVRPRVDVADVKGSAEWAAQCRRRDVDLPSGAAHDEPLTTPRGQLVARIHPHRPVSARVDAQAAADAAAAVEPQAPAGVDGQGAWQACSGERRGVVLVDRIGLEQRPSPEPRRWRLLAAGISRRHARAGQAAEKPPDHASHPAGESPKLCSMNEKSVRTCASKTRLNTPKFTNDAARSLQNLTVRSPPASSQ